MATVCPEESKISDFVSRALQVSSIAQIEAHIADCGDCRNLVYALAGTEERAEVERVGRFELIELIGHGAMGSVYRAHDPELDRHVAVKIRRGNARLDVAAEDRLRREAQALAKLTHQNVVAVYETGRHAEMAYVAMELVDGVTLDGWLVQARSQRAALDVMLGAGRGLAAAHEVGLIHRDFKPQNVFVSKADVAKVGDFGLVRVGHGEAVSSISPTSDLVVTLSVAGSIIGTPAYMAPEQLSGEVATEASDQFSFCVTLFEALYGARPFGGTTVEALLAAMRGGVQLPAKSRVPRHVRRVLARGLSFEPRERFASMAVLLDELAHRRSVGTWAAVGVGVAAVAAVGVLAVTARDADACSGSERELAGIWDGKRRDAVTAAFEATGVGHAAEVATKTTDLLDRHAKVWIGAHRDACEATRVRKSQPESVLALRNACLAERRGELRALTDLFVRADASTIDNAIDATVALERIEQCADISALQQVVRPPSDPVKRVLVEARRAELAHLIALMNVARADEALALAKPLAAATEELGYAPLQADALTVLGTLLHDVGKDDDAIAALREAAATADAAGDDRSRFEAYDSLLQVLTYTRRVDQLDDALLQLRGIVARQPYDAGMTNRLLLLEGFALVAKQKPAEAIPKYRALIASIEKAGRDDDPELGMAYTLLSDALARAGKTDEVIAAAKRGEEVLAKAYGPSRSASLEAKSNDEQAKIFQAMMLIDQQKTAEGIALAESAQAKLVQLHGPDHGSVGMASHMIGVGYSDLGQYEKAREHHHRALEIHLRIHGHDNIKIAASLMELARIDLVEKNFEKAAKQYDEARDIFVKVRGADSMQAVAMDLFMVRALIGAGDLDGASKHLARARELGGSTLGKGAQTFVLEAEILVERGKPAQAIVVLEKAYAMPRGEGEWVGHAEHVWARALARQHKKAEAVVHAEKAIAELEKRRKKDELPEVQKLLASLR